MKSKLISDICVKATEIGYKTHIIQNGPKILLGVGVCLSVGGVVKCCLSTLKVPDIIEEHKEEREIISDVAETVDGSDNIESIESNRTSIVKLYLRTGKKLMRTYAVGSSMFILGIAFILCAYHILNGRYVALTSAYNALMIAHNNYRKRVRDEYGEDVDYNFSHGIFTHVEEVKDEKGNVIGKENVNYYRTEFAGSPYLVYFNEETSSKYIRGSKFYSMTPRLDRLATLEMNLSQLINIEDELTAQLQAKKDIPNSKTFISLRHVWEVLALKLADDTGNIFDGIKEIPVGNIGWTYITDENCNFIGPGDGKISFGIRIPRKDAPDKWNTNPYDIDKRCIDYKTGNIVLDFNVDGDCSRFLSTLIPAKKFEKDNEVQS